ncbi:MAG: hypothetical protein C0625_14430 [Arcobacter sp.]|nr:MAG: hypothetical protein C0625_14430 [Arcobacter sp.]
MKKISSLSLIASILLAGSAYADNLNEAFAKSKYKGELKAAYVHSNFLGTKTSDSVTAVGGNLGMVTGDFYGFKAGATLQASSVLHDGIDYSDGVSKRANYFDASGAVLSESYLEYTLANTSLKAGRQFIHTPLVSSGIDGKSSEAIIKDSFEAYLLTNTDIPDTTFVAGYVNKFQPQTDSAGKPGKFDKFQDDVYTIYVKNNSIKNLTLQAQYLDEQGIQSNTDRDVFYFQADYKLSSHTISAQYLASTDKSQAANAQDGELFGLKATGPLGIWKLGYLVAYNASTDKNAAVYTGAGEGTTDTPFTAMPVHDGGVPTRPDTDTLVGAIVAPIAGATVIGYGGKSSSSTHPIGDVKAAGAMVIYPIVKNLLLKVNYEHVSVEKIFTKSTDTARVYLSYSF